MATQTMWQIAGMHCGNCAQRLGDSLQRLDEVTRTEVDEAGTATVRYGAGRLSEDDLGERVWAAGFDLA